jgi:hypothetical protein
VQSARDLARADPWRESLERSQARRGLARAKPNRPPARPRAETHAPAEPRPPRRERSRRTARAHRSGRWLQRALSTRLTLPSLGPKSVAALALFAAIVASGLAGGGSRDSPPAARADAPQAASISGPTSAHAAKSSAAATGWAGCPLAVARTGYVNPLGGATVKPERIDQGVDYAGSGVLVAIGTARVTYVATSNTGWPGTFLEYQLLDGADAGCFVFYAEGVTPVDGLRAGQIVSAGDTLATIIPKWPTGIEIGWGAGIATKAYAKVAGQWSTANDEANVATAAGKNFSALIAALGGPPGIVEG